MKKTIFFALAIFSCSLSFAQLKTTTVCPQFVVDILDGKVNGMPINSTVGQIKKAMPCATGTDNDSATCGSRVSYKDKDIYFFVRRHYIEIGPAFKGKLSVPLMGAARTSLFKTLGHPRIKDVNWDAYTTNYGILILYFNKAGKINKIQMSTEGTETIQLCD
jgi:hypothetical protein